MPQDNQQIYYMVVDEKSTGPFTLDEIILHPKLTPDTLVWKPGIDNWIAAKTFQELAPAFVNRQPETNSYQNPPEYKTYNESGGYDQPGPPFADNPQYRTDHTYHRQERRYEAYEPHYDRYQNSYRPQIRTNWLPWAIVATIVGFFTSCIGAIFGIIGIVQANRANRMYLMGYDREGDAANSNAKIMTIIGLIFAGIGIAALFWFGNIFNSLSNLSYL